ncbi:MAG: ArsR family transcriptional regulator [Caulobacterales bacterium 68-7]|nr:metalloregulator ArsR/SmtB family transcription factor [Caulobacterales bacterium]OJU08564.1 MAG: ArsR family transcriptional regulator [Caulobacterales bacterium 68-7]
MTVSSEQLVEILRAAGEPTRLRILALLAHEELSVLELGRILDQSQPRVSRHLKLLAEAGLVERFPDGAWVFYRLAAGGEGRTLVEQALALVDPADAGAVRDVGQLAAVRAERSDAAASYFARNAARWDEIRSLYVDEAEVEAAVLAAAGAGPFDRLIDLGAGTGRMLTLLGGRAQSAVGLDLSQQMLNIARNEVAKAGLAACELRHGDIFATRLPDGAGDLVTVHQVLHYLGDPAAAVAEAARLTAPGGKLVIVDFAPHELEFLREQHQHRRLGFSDEEMHRWLAGAGLEPLEPQALAPARAGGLTVKVWTARRAANVERSAA